MQTPNKHRKIEHNDVTLFRFASEHNNYTKQELQALLTQKIQKIVKCVKTGETLFFGSPNATAYSIGDQKIYGLITCALQLQNQHNILLTGSLNNTYLYNFKSRTVEQIPHLGNASHAVQLPDSRVLFAKLDTLFVTDPVSFEILHKITFQAMQIFMIPVTETLFSITANLHTTIWSSKRMKQVRTLIKTKFVRRMVALENGRLAAIHDDNTIKIFNVRTGELLQVLSGHSKLIWGLVAVGNQIVSCSPDTTLRFWNSNTGECERVVTTPPGYYSLSLKADNSISIHGDNACYFYQEKTGIVPAEKELNGATCAVALIEYPHLLVD
jgi:WD40 repeat protein